MHQEIKHNSKIPQRMNTSFLTVLVKPDKDPTQCPNYCPLSLISTDIQIIHKTLSNHIENVIPP